MSEAYLGEIRLFAFDKVPNGWLPCNGLMLQPAFYEQLSELLGTSFGGNGITNFALPDLRGRVGISQGSDGAGNSYALGDKGGTETVELDAFTVPSHNHPLHATASNATTSSGADAYFAQPTASVSTATVENLYGLGARAGLTYLNSNVVRYEGGNMPHQNMQPFMAMTYAICVNGMTPPPPDKTDAKAGQ